jgi:oligosaccharide repeat unit polymerase
MPIDLFLFAALAATIALSRKLYRDVFAPLCTYVSMWLVCLLLFRLRLVGYYELEPRTIALIAGSLIAFAVGCLLAHRRAISREGAGDLRRTIDLGSLEFVIKALIALNFAGALIFAYQMNSAYGISTYFTDPAVIRKDFAEWTRVGALGLFMMLDYPLIVSAWVHYLLTRKLRWFTVLAVPLVSIQTFLKTDRGSLTIYAITCIALWIYWHDWRALNWRMVRRLAISVVLLLAYFLAIGSLYGKLVSMQADVFNPADLSVTSQVGLVLVTPYIYATSPISGFQEAMRDVGTLSWGMHTFFPIARVLYSVGILQDRPEPVDFDYYFVPIPVNTYTHLFAFYQDFGAAGVILLPLVLGFVETRLYFHMKCTPTLFSMGASSTFMAVNVFSVFVPAVGSLSFWYYWAVLYVVYRFCRHRELPFSSKNAIGTVPGTA